MTLPSSGSMTLSMIQAEFGGSNPISLSEYYAGGAYVPAGTTGINGAVPSSGSISLSSFYGTSASATYNYTVTVGTSTLTVGSGKTSLTYAYWGFRGFAPTCGNMTPAPSPWGDWAIFGCYHQSIGNTLILGVSGDFPNSGWNYITIGSTIFYRADAEYINNGSDTAWGWTSGNLFGTTPNATKAVAIVT